MSLAWSQCLADDELTQPIGGRFFGGRICPGRHFAEDVLFITIASILHVFDIVPALDAHGRPISVELKATSGFISYVSSLHGLSGFRRYEADERCVTRRHVEHFAYSVRPRSNAAEALIQGEV